MTSSDNQEQTATEDTTIEKLSEDFFRINALLAETVDGLTSSKLKGLIKHMNLYPFKTLKDEEFGKLSKAEQTAYTQAAIAKDIFMNLMFLTAKEKADGQSEVAE